MSGVELACPGAGDLQPHVWLDEIQYLSNQSQRVRAACQLEEAAVEQVMLGAPCVPVGVGQLAQLRHDLAELHQIRRARPPDNRGDPL